ncbi:unnamed protein product [Larinioides sclopetarius]|uniref:CRAL-TRIO domain-containing protein n=1 Tax=Larinioides sclopetarius TaxID=280406 RepID=A0AAV1ZC96_9ARAC
MTTPTLALLHFATFSLFQFYLTHMFTMDLDSQAIKYTRLEATSLEGNFLKAIQEEIGETEESRRECLRILSETLNGVIDYSKISFEGRSFLDIISTVNILKNPITQMCGITIIFDFADFKYSSLLAVNPKIAFDYMYYMQKAFPLRIKAFHVINASSVFWAFYKLFCLVMSKKLRRRIYVYPNNDNWKSLHSCIPPEILPEDLGGHLPKSRLIDLLDDVEKLEKETLEQFQFGYKITKHVRMSMKIIEPDK